jgi:hypothetical protein
MNLLIGIVMLAGYLMNVCVPIPVFTYENHPFCNGIGVRTLYICVDDSGHFVEWQSTCSSGIESGHDVELMFLPLMIKGE